MQALTCLPKVPKSHALIRNVVSCRIKYSEITYLQIAFCVFGFCPTPITNYNLLIFSPRSRNKEYRSLLLKQRTDMLVQSWTKFLVFWYLDGIEHYEINSDLRCCFWARENEMVTSSLVSTWLPKNLEDLPSKVRILRTYKFPECRLDALVLFPYLISNHIIAWSLQLSLLTRFKDILFFSTRPIRNQYWDTLLVYFPPIKWLTGNRKFGGDGGYPLKNFVVLVSIRMWKNSEKGFCTRDSDILLRQKLQISRSRPGPFWQG